MICHQVKEVNSKEELQAIFQDDANMDVLMNTGFTSTISLEKRHYCKVQCTDQYSIPRYVLLLSFLELFHFVSFVSCYLLWLNFMILPNFQ